MISHFLKRVWQFITAIKNASGNLLFLLLIGLIIVSIFNTETQSVPESAALVIDPSGIVVEQKKAIDPIENFLSNYENEESETLLKDVLDAIDLAAKDTRIKIIVLDLSKFQGAAFSKLEEIGNALEAFKLSGKSVYAFGKAYSQSQYYIASHADEVFIDESSHQLLGGVFLTGLGVYPTYYKSALDKLKVNIHIYKSGLYKSAIEPFMRDDMSAQAKLANQSWLNRLWNEYAHSISRERKISLEEFVQYTGQYDELLGAADDDPNQLAVQQNLVDELLTKQEWLTLMQDMVGGNGTSFNHINFQDYLSATHSTIPPTIPGSDQIAVIIASGVIYDGERPAGEIGSATISKLIEQAREDESVKALVMRIDSPGGSASASEEIRNELALTKAAGKPIVVSMSSYAASGGYWIAADANKIFALSTTITGSIGTFLIFPTLEQTAADYGIYTDGVGTTALSGSLNPLKDVSPILDRSLQRSVKHTYQKFIQLVADGRNMSIEQVEVLAQGRVWAAKDALENGLIDAIGNLDDAIASAALLADVSAFETLYLEQQLSPKEVLLHEILSSSLQMIHKINGGIKLDGGSFSVASLLPPEISEMIEMSKKPGLYLQCLECKISY